MSLIGCHVVSLVFTLRLSTQLNCGPRPALNGAAPATPVAVTSLRQFSRGESRLTLTTHDTLQIRLGC